MNVPKIEAQKFLRVIAEIRDELDHLAKVVKEVEEALSQFSKATPNLIEIRGLAALILDFYNGVESIFETIAGDLNGGLPLGDKWHKGLLRDMTLEIPKTRPPVLTKELYLSLEELLRFRHLFIHSYGFTLRWDRINELLAGIPALFSEYHSQLQKFLEFLSKLVDESEQPLKRD